jgi:hypothetical protein
MAWKNIPDYIPVVGLLPLLYKAHQKPAKGENYLNRQANIAFRFCANMALAMGIISSLNYFSPSAEAHRRREVEFETKVEKILSPQGYADLDKNGMPSVNEYAALLQRINVDRPFPKPRGILSNDELDWYDIRAQFTTEDLEKIVQSYDNR